MVVVLSVDLAAAEAANAAAVLGLAGAAYCSSLGPEGKDADGTGYGPIDRHPIPVLVASPEEIAVLHRRTLAEPELRATAFTEIARRSRDYDEYVDLLAQTPSTQVQYVGLVVHGPRGRVTRLTKRLHLYADRATDVGS